MQKQYIEVTVTVDSSDALAHPRKACIAVDQIASFVDISEQKPPTDNKVKITLTEPDDYINTDDEAGGVVRCQRTLYVQEDYKTIRIMIEAAGINQRQ